MGWTKHVQIFNAINRFLISKTEPENRHFPISLDFYIVGAGKFTKM